MTNRSDRWSNASVLRLSQGGDPVSVITEFARRVVIRAIDTGWSGPPFSPIALAERLKIPVTASDEVRDARTVPSGKGGVRIEFNPNRPSNRVRYSSAHEIAHTLFPDCAAFIRNRTLYHEMQGDSWQIEALCNIAAAEFLMPVGSIPSLEPSELDIQQLMELRQQYQVSAEAFLIRVARMAKTRCAMFCARRIEHGTRAGRYLLDYLITSRTWKRRYARGFCLPARSAVSECIAIGFTAIASEQWDDGAPLHVECIGIPPYPGGLYPRVVGILTPVGARVVEEPLLQYLRGDATEPRSAGPKIIAHIVNDATPNWGGGGFASSVRRKWPAVQADFQSWASRDPSSFSLGRVHVTEIDGQRCIMHMVAQRGYGPAARPRLRYTALQSCLEALGRLSEERGASIHMPRIGTGHGVCLQIVGPGDA